VHEAVALLLDHLPRQLHLLLATRSDPPLALARLRSRGELLELPPSLGPRAPTASAERPRPMTRCIRHHDRPDDRLDGEVWGLGGPPRRLRRHRWTRAAARSAATWRVVALAGWDPCAG
jgi:hypothetical protein